MSRYMAGEITLPELEYLQHKLNGDPLDVSWRRGKADTVEQKCFDHALLRLNRDTLEYEVTREGLDALGVK